MSITLTDETADMLIRRLLTENHQLKLKPEAEAEPKVTIREAIKLVLSEHPEITSRELNAHLRRLPIATRSRNLPALVQTTLGEMAAQKEVLRRGHRGRMKYSPSLAA